MAEGTIIVLSSLHESRSDRLPTLWDETVPSVEPTMATTVDRVHIVCLTKGKGKGKAISLQAWTGPEGFRRLKLPDFKTIDT